MLKLNLIQNRLLKSKFYYQHSCSVKFIEHMTSSQLCIETTGNKISTHENNVGMQSIFPATDISCRSHKCWDILWNWYPAVFCIKLIIVICINSLQHRDRQVNVKIQIQELIRCLNKHSNLSGFAVLNTEKHCDTLERCPLSASVPLSICSVNYDSLSTFLFLLSLKILNDLQ